MVQAGALKAKLCYFGRPLSQSVQYHRGISIAILQKKNRTLIRSSQGNMNDRVVDPPGLKVPCGRGLDHAGTMNVCDAVRRSNH